MKNDLFESIDKEKEEFPILNKTIKEVEKYKYNFYQKIAIYNMIICIFVGIVIGNLFPSCTSNGLYTTNCTSTEFNTALTIFFWFLSFLVSMFIFFMGHVIQLLSEINKNIKNNVK